MFRIPREAAPAVGDRVLIAGGGIAAVETLLALRAAAGGERFDVTMIAPQPQLAYRPLAVGEPFGVCGVRRYRLDAICADLGARLLPGALEGVDAGGHVAELRGGARVPYDVLVIATGARAEPALAHVDTVFADDAPAELRRIVREVEEGRTRSIAFVVPPRSTWLLPLYELALMTAERARAVGAVDLTLTLVTPEDRPLAIFHGAGSAAVARLLEAAGVAVEAGTYAHDYDGRELTLTPGDRRLVAERVVALPQLTGPRIAGLPADADGFVRVDEHWRVPHVKGVYAVGDATTFPLKQGGLAAQHADAVAEQIARARSGRNGVTFDRPHLRAMLLTGKDPLYLTATIAGGESVASSASRECPWWPPHKIAARHLAPFLADRAEGT